MSVSLLQQNTQRYADLTQQMDELVDEIAHTEEELTQRKLFLADEKKHLDTIGDAIVEAAIAEAGGVKEFGSSEDIRKRAAQRVKAMDRTYVQQEQRVSDCEIDVLQTQDTLSDLNRRYGATCFQVSHHAALMHHAGLMLYVAGPNSQIKFDLPVATPNGFNGSTVTAEDAEAAGF